MGRFHDRHYSRRLLGAAAGLVAAASLAACGGSSSSGSATTAAGSSGGSGAGTATTASSGGNGGNGNVSSKLNSISQSVRSGASATYKAVYTFSEPGSNGTVTIEQKPPKTLFKAGGGVVINNGTTTYYCSSTSGAPTCLNAGTGSANPLAGLTQLFSPTQALNALQQAQAQAAANAQGASVTFTTESFSGVSADCANVTNRGQAGKYCVTHEGVLAYAGTATSNFQLTSYSTSAPDSDFSLPAGASTVTIPGGGTIPGIP